MNNLFNSAPRQQNQPTAPETQRETPVSIAVKLKKLQSQIESTRLEIKEAATKTGQQGIDGILLSLRNRFDTLTEAETELSAQRTQLQRASGEKFELVPSPKEDVWEFTPKARTTKPPLSGAKNLKKTLGNGSPTPEEFKKPPLKINEAGAIELI